MAGSSKSCPTAASENSRAADGRECARPATATPPTRAACVRGTKLTQAEFAARIGVPIETVRNWEQGKRSPRGPARALLKLIEKAPDVAFAVLGAARTAR